MAYKQREWEGAAHDETQVVHFILTETDKGPRLAVVGRAKEETEGSTEIATLAGTPLRQLNAFYAAAHDRYMDAMERARVKKKQATLAKQRAAQKKVDRMNKK